MRGREKKEGGDWFRTFRSIRGKMQRAKKKKKAKCYYRFKVSKYILFILAFFF
jgi:hypothetical protein